jgi:spermidine synthase
VADRLRAPARAYAVAEVVVGAYAIVAPWIFDHAYPLGAATSPLGRVALAFALLAAPTAAMGATLPLLTAATVTSRGGLRRGVGALYTVNLAGGVAGALMGGFVLLPRLGLRGTTLVLGCSAITVAAGAIAASRSRVEPAVASAPGPSRVDPIAPWIAAWVGALSFALQVAYNRVLALLLGAAAYTFALVVAVILASSALGGWVGARSSDDDEPAVRGVDRFWSRVARRCLALSLAVYLGALVVYVAPFYVAWAASHLRSMLGVRVALVVLVVGVPSYQIGALFPALASRFPARASGSAHDAVGRAAGRAVLVTTLGNVAGALGAAFVAIPLRGVEQTLGAASALALVPALVAAHRAGRAPFVGIAAASILACSLSLALRPEWNAVGLSAGSYRVRGYRARKDDCAGAPFTDNRLLYSRDGPVGTVVVLGHAGGDRCSLYSLRVNGKAEGSVFVAAPLEARVPPHAPTMPIGDLPSETLAGILPAVTGPAPERTMLVGWGTGISARALLAGGAAQVEAAELEPAVLEAARLFDPDVERDPRVTIAIDDARMVLRRAPSASYDAIVSHPSNPWVVGASALFSREYFALARDRLRAGGRMLTWIQLYEMDAVSARTLVATFVEAFPDAHAFRVSATARDVFLVGLRTEEPTSRATLAATIASRATPSVLAALRDAGLDGEGALAQTEIADGAALARYARGFDPDSDDRATLEYRLAGNVLRGTGDDAASILRDLDAR